jgi:DNA uptake protein ComE-like DNA-binding protein
MATGEQIIERLGGGGPVGLAVAAVVLAPTFLPPVRRGLRGLAKAVIIQYLRVSELRVPVGPARAGAAGPAAARRGRRRGGGEATAPATGATAPPARPRARQGRAAAAPEPAAPTAAPARPRRTRDQAAPNSGGAAAPARAPRGRRGEGAGQPPATAAPQARRSTAAAPQGAGEETAGEGSRAGARNGKLNLNTASRAELTQLPRVGAQTADRIIQFREQQGPIRNLRQLRQADILPLSAYRQIRELVRV